MPLQVIDIPAPAFYGIAKDRSQFPLGPEWASEATNLVIDTTGRISARKGWSPVNSGTIDSGAAIVQIHEYINAAGTSEIISSTAGNIFSGTTSPTSKKGALTPSAGNWKFRNFNGKCVGWQASHTPIVYTGTGNFAAITASTGTSPDGNTVCAAFGRLWGLDDDKQTIRYCALLDETKWAVADGGGVIDMRTVWTQGMDEVVAIEAFGSNLVVFGRRHIIIWTDGSGSQLGLNPLNMYVTDTIDNVGLVARDARAMVGEVDIIFWSSSGIRSLVRTVQERATPANSISPNNHHYSQTGQTSSNSGSIRAVHSPQEGLVLMVAPSLDKTFVFDVRFQLPDGGYRMIEWSIEPTALACTVAGTLYFGFPGDIGQYTGYQDDGVAYQFRLESGWIDIKGEQKRKHALKALKSYMYTEIERPVQFSWGVDFGLVDKTQTVTIGLSATAAKWGVAEWGLGLFGPAGAVERDRLPLSREAEYFKVGATTSVNGSVFAMQPLALYSRPTRLA